MIYTVTFNPALDYVIQIQNLNLGETCRSTDEAIFFGGKGINVSLVLRELGVENTALGFVAGFTGKALEENLKEKGIQTDFISLPSGLTRINVKMKGEKETEINAQGPRIPAESLSDLMEKLNGLRSGDTLVLAGSIPSSLPSDIYEKILSELQGKGIRFVVDATGELLKKVLKFHPFLVKPNHRELEELVGSLLFTKEDLIRGAKALQEMGARNVLISRGKDGALLLSEQGDVYQMPALGGKPVNTVGAGDSMVAGFLAGVEKGYEYALALGSAAGGATACSMDLAKKEDIDALMAQCF